MNCSKNCKSLGYNYYIDELGCISGIEDYICYKYHENLGNIPVKCTKCLENLNKKQWNKNNKKFFQ